MEEVIMDLRSLKKTMDLASEHIPSHLELLIGTIDAGAEEYPDRVSDIESFRGWIANGDLDMAKHSAEEIIRRQEAVRAGPPPVLQQMWEQIETEAEEYPDRESDIERFRDWIANGDFDMAKHTATEIIRRQQSLRSARTGLPPVLQQLWQQIEAEAEEYPDRESDIESFRDWIANGDFDMAKHRAEEIIRRQEAARTGPPPVLQQLWEQIETEAEEYPDRESDIERFRDWIANGDFDMAKHTATEIIRRQQSLRSARTVLPSVLQQLWQQIEAEAEEYPDRKSDIESFRDWIENGDFDMATHTAESIISRQKNIRSNRNY